MKSESVLETKASSSDYRRSGESKTTIVEGNVHFIPVDSGVVMV